MPANDTNFKLQCQSLKKNNNTKDLQYHLKWRPMWSKHDENNGLDWTGSGKVGPCQYHTTRASIYG